MTSVLRVTEGGRFHVHDVLELEAPRARVYEMVADVARYPEFIADVPAVRVDGDTCLMTLRVGPMQIPLRTRVERVPPREVTFTLLDGPIAKLVGRWTLEGDESRTTIRLEAEGEAGALGRWMLRMAGQVADRHIQKVEAAFRARAASLAAAAGPGGNP